MDAEALGRMILGELGDFAQAEIGVLYSLDIVRGEGLQLLAVRGHTDSSDAETRPIRESHCFFEDCARAYVNSHHPEITGVPNGFGFIPGVDQSSIWQPRKVVHFLHFGRWE